MRDFKISGNGSFEEETFGQVSIKGSGSCNADTHKVHVSGQGTFTGGELDGTSISGTGQYDTQQKDIRINGTGKLAGGVFGRVKINGSAHCAGDLKAEALYVGGTFKCSGSITAETFACNGTVHSTDAVKARKLDVNGLLYIKNGTSLEADEIKCMGTIRIGGQISADHLNARGVIFAQEIVGDRIVIRSRPNLLVRLFIKTRSEIGLIEATSVELSGVNAQSVNGSDVVIGPNCQIQNLDCSGSLSIDPSSTVVHLTGNYTMR